MTECHTDSNGRNNRTEVHDEKNDRIILHDCMCIQCSGMRMEDADIAKEEERKALNYGTAKWNFRQDHNGDWTVDI